MTSAPLPAVLDLSAARIFAETLQAATGPMALDGSHVERIGVAGLQLLLSAQATASAAGNDFAITQPSEPLRAAVRIAGADILLATDR